MDSGNMTSIVVISLVFGAGVIITVSIFWLDHRTRKAALDVLRAYAERGDEPPASVVQALTAVSSRATGHPGQAGATARPTSRANHLAHAAANAVTVAGLGFLWWVASTMGESGALVALIAFVVGLFFAASLAAAGGRIPRAIGSMSDDDDSALVSAVHDGSELAFNTLVDRHQQAVRMFLRRLLGNDADADDLAQETFLAAWTHARSFRGGASVRSWLCGVAWRKAKGAQRSWFRWRTRDTAHHERLSSDLSPGAPVEDRLAVRTALRTLPLDQRAAVTLCLVCGFSHAAAAAILGAPLATVKSHVLRGRERLRQAMERTV